MEEESISDFKSVSSVRVKLTNNATINTPETKKKLNEKIVLSPKEHATNNTSHRFESGIYAL
jgi:hypothetical protein